MKKWMYSLMVFLLIAGYASAQEYNTSLGLRLGTFPGVTAKTFIAENHALEGSLSTRGGGALISGLYEIQKPFTELPSFFWYIGGGAHTGFWPENNKFMDETFVLGGSFVLGAEYVFPEVPFVISIDWNPAINLVGPSGIWFDKGAIGVRYIIN